MTSITRRESLQRLAALAVGAPLAGVPFATRAFAAPAILTGRYSLFGPQGRQYSARAVRIVEETITVDMLNQFRFADFAEKPPKSQKWLNTPGSFTEADWEQYRTSGLRVFGLGHGVSSYEEGIRFFADWNGFIAGYGDWFMRIDDARDFERARAAGKVGVMLTFQDSAQFRTADDVNTFWALGLRVSQLTYNYANRIGAGFLETRDGGLTVFGGEIVKRMNEVGMAVDVSHCGDQTTLDGIAASGKPVIFTHAACRALQPGALRLKTDEMIRNMAKTGGVMGIPFLRMMIRADEPVNVEHVLDHFDHAVKLVGVEHVGVGSDMDLVGNPNPVNGPPMRPTPNWDRYKLHVAPDGTWMLTIAGLDHPRRMFDLAEGLIARRYGDADIALMLGGNWRRVLGEIWAA